MISYPDRDISQHDFLSIEEVTGDDLNPLRINFEDELIEVYRLTNITYLEAANNKNKFKENLTNFIHSTQNCCTIITDQEYTFGIIKQDKIFYFFDSHGRTPNGQISKSKNDNSKACLIRFSNVDEVKNINQLADHINKFTSKDNYNVELTYVHCHKKLIEVSIRKYLYHKLCKSHN
jgi:hypothetical protein